MHLQTHMVHDKETVNSLVNKQQFQFYQWRKLSRKYDVLFKPLRLYRLLNLNITPYEETKLSPNLEENPNLIRPGDWSV